MFNKGAESSLEEGLVEVDLRVHKLLAQSVAGTNEELE